VAAADVVVMATQAAVNAYKVKCSISQPSQRTPPDHWYITTCINHHTLYSSRFHHSQSPKFNNCLKVQITTDYSMSWLMTVEVRCYTASNLNQTQCYYWPPDIRRMPF